jgi:hypothetical protein
MDWLRALGMVSAIAGSAALLACGPVHSVTVGRGEPPREAPPVVVREGGGHGPPPWAPAHGYRHKHQRAYQSRPDTVDLVFDSGMGVYVVVGVPNVYYFDGVYLRVDAGQWYRASYLDTRWSPCPAEQLPGHLRENPARRGDDDHPGKGKGKAKGKGHGRGHGQDDQGEDD